MEAKVEVSKFQLLAGTYMGSRIFSEYAMCLRAVIDKSVKGQTTLHNRLEETEIKMEKMMGMVTGEIRTIVKDLGLLDDTVDYMETIMHDILTLDEDDQRRVKGLILKLKRERNER